MILQRIATAVSHCLFPVVMCLSCVARSTLLLERMMAGVLSDQIDKGWWARILSDPLQEYASELPQVVWLLGTQPQLLSF